jgi:Holliday junction resolvasome RuvABC endonuclease subunit
MNILALDLATKTGWAVAKSGGLPSMHDVEDFSLKRGESQAVRWLKFSAWLSCHIDELKRTNQNSLLPPLIVCEEPIRHFLGSSAAEVCYALHSRVQEQCHFRGVTLALVHPMTLKKFATGSGRADKAAMLAGAQARWGKHIKDHNEADALWVLQWAQHNLVDKQPAK